MRGVPEGWVRVRMTDVVHINPTKIRPDYEDRTPVVFVPMARVAEELGGIDVTERRPFAAIKRGYTQFQPGDVLFAKITPCMENGKIAIVPEIHPPLGYGSTEFFVMRPRADSIGPWIAYCVSRSRIRTLARKNMQGAVGQLRVPRNWLEDVEIPFAPIPEQHRIVAKLDELFSELDAGVAALERAQATLKRYRASMLKAAVEGKLTEEWRQKNPPDETGEELLQSILVERRNRWEEEQLAKFKAKGQNPPKNWQQKYKKPPGPAATDLPGLPEGWYWTNIDTLIVRNPQNGIYLPSRKYGDGREILRIEDFQNDWIRHRSELKQVEVGQDIGDSYGLNDGDLVINRVNSMTHLGKCVVISEQLRGVLFESNMMRVTHTTKCNPKFVEYYLHSQPGRHLLTKDAKWAVNQASINQQDVRRTPIPLPPFVEQEAIVEVVKDQLSAIEHIQAAIDTNLKDAQGLRQAILRHAFSGKLVPQHPNDEPASLFLERIRLAREVEGPKKSRRSRTSAQRIQNL